MRKVLYLFALVLASGTLSAQFTMSSSDIYNVGATRIYTGLDTTGIVEGMGGTGVTWDFSGATATTQTRTITVTDASTHPEASSFPGSTHAYDIVSTGEYRFYTKNADSMVFDGEISLLNSPISYSVRPTIYQFPLNPNDLRTDSLYSFYNTGSAGFAFRFGTYNTLFDASGTLMLPGGVSYSNVDRILTFVDVRDSSQAFPFYTDIQIARYEWFVQGASLPVMTSETRTVSANGGAPNTTKEVFFYDSSIVSIDEPLLIHGMELYPNPATDQVRVQYQLDGNTEVSLRIYNLMGEEIWLQSEDDQVAGAYNVSVPTAELSRGVYFVRLSAGEDIQTKKLILK